MVCCIALLLSGMVLYKLPHVCADMPEYVQLLWFLLVHCAVWLGIPCPACWCVAAAVVPLLLE
jgi:hypothetical protein